MRPGIEAQSWCDPAPGRGLVLNSNRLHLPVVRPRLKAGAGIPGKAKMRAGGH